MYIKLTQWTSNKTGNPVWVNMANVACFRVSSGIRPSGTVLEFGGKQFTVAELPDEIVQLVKSHHEY